jgi:hypothetical protein
MKEDIIDNIKQEASSGVAQIIGRIFQTLFEPILKGID